MFTPGVQSLFCLSLLTVPYVSAFPVDENLQPRADTSCNANHVKTVNNSSKQPVTFCKSWLASKHSQSTVKGLNVAQVSNACKCIQASVSSSSVAAAKKTSSIRKVTSSTRKASTLVINNTASKKTPSSTIKSSTIKSSTIKSSTIKSSTIKSSTIKSSTIKSSTIKSSTIKSSTINSSVTKKTSTSSQKTTSKTASSNLQSTSTKPSTSLKQSTSTSKTTARSTIVTSEKSTWTPVSTKHIGSSTSTKHISTLTSSSRAPPSSSSTHSNIFSSSSFSSSSVSSTTEFSSSAIASSTLFFTNSSSNAIPTDSSSTSIVAQNKVASSVSTRSPSTNIASTSSPSAKGKLATPGSTGTGIITNGNFAQGSVSGWGGARAVGTKFSVASLAGGSNYEALVKYALDANDNASGQLYQTVSIPANSAWQLSADVYLNYPKGLPANVSCIVKYSLGSDDIILKQYGATSKSGAILSDTASGQLSTAFNGRFQIDTYCNSASSAAASFALGFTNIQLFIADAGSVPSSSSASSTTSTAAAASTSGSAPSSTGNLNPSSTITASPTASANATNRITNGDFGTGDYKNWALYRLGNPTFAVQGNPGSYVSVITFPAGGDASSQAGLLQQPAIATSGRTYTLSMGLLLNYPAGLPADGSVCTLQVYMVDGNGFGVLFAQTKYGNGDAAFQSVTGSGTVNNGFDGVFAIMLRCYGSTAKIVAGIEDVVVTES